MSRAFVRESDQDAAALPERVVSAYPNFVTARGLAAIETQVRELEAQRQAARTADDALLLARIERDLRYWTSRRASARLVEPPAETERVRFGMRVTLQLRSGATRAFRLVGEDEADGAQSLIGREVGDTMLLQGGEAELLGIDP